MTGTDDAPVVALGIDPGFASTGISVVARFADGSYRSCGVKVSRTKKIHDRSYDRLNTTADDDSRRLREHQERIVDAIVRIKPHVIGIENYLVFEPKGPMLLRLASTELLGLLGQDPTQVARCTTDEVLLAHLVNRLQAVKEALGMYVSDAAGLGNAAKTIAVFGMVHSIAHHAGVKILTFPPAALKQRFGGKRGASKEEVGQGLQQIVHDLTEKVNEAVPQKRLKEHAWDATGHAILAADLYASFAA
jgi:Holliday junction resolvasome RuvABC endonuclease subunit